MSNHTDLIVLLGFVLVCVDGWARIYMDVLIHQSPISDAGYSSTERTYMQLVRKREAPLWPFVVTVIFIPLGILTVFAGIFSSK